MEGYVFESYDEVVTFLTERGPVRQFQVLYLDDDEELPPEWTITIPNSNSSEDYADE